VGFAFIALLFPTKDIALFVYEKHFDFHCENKVEGKENQLDKGYLGDVPINDYGKNEKQ
jgi:hypothetical protein